MTVIGCATHSDHLSLTSIQPSIAPQATTAGAVMARRPAITPISRARQQNENLGHADLRAVDGHRTLTRATASRVKIRSGRT